MARKQARTRVIPPVQVTEEERRKFKALAESEHLTLTALIRRLLHQAADSKQVTA